MSHIKPLRIKFQVIFRGRCRKAGGRQYYIFFFSWWVGIKGKTDDTRFVDALTNIVCSLGQILKHCSIFYAPKLFFSPKAEALNIYFINLNSSSQYFICFYESPRRVCSKNFGQRRQSHCIALAAFVFFLHCVFWDVSSYCPTVRMHSYISYIGFIGCTCFTFLHCAIWEIISKYIWTLICVNFEHKYIQNFYD